MTDARLDRIEPYHRDLSSLSHAEIKAMLMNDVRDFLRSPTMGNLSVVVGQLLSYQDSHLLGRRRKP